MAEYTAPSGARIRGTLEELSGVAEINGIGDDGEPEYSGDTDIWWNEQRTVYRSGERVFVDEKGDEWKQSQLIRKGTKQKTKKPCRHLTGYWINKAVGNFRCYKCGSQFHIGDNLPANHPTKGIEVWEADRR